MVWFLLLFRIWPKKIGIKLTKTIHFYPCVLAPCSTDWYLLIQYFSLLFLKNGSLAGRTCSMTMQVISDVWWPGKEKCCPVGWLMSFLLTYPLCFFFIRVSAHCSICTNKSIYIKMRKNLALKCTFLGQTR